MIRKLKLLHAIGMALLVSGPAAAENSMLRATAPQWNFGLIDALAARDGARSMVSGQLSRIETNVQIGTRADGVLARLAAASGPDGWPTGAYGADIMGVIDDWQISLKDALAPATGTELPGFAPPLIPDWAQFPSPFHELPTAAEPSVPMRLIYATAPVVSVPQFHVVFPAAQISGGFFSAH